MNESVFKALADPNRRRILRLLSGRTMSAGEIAAHFSVARSTLSSHFNILKKADLIQEEKNGTTVYYSLNLSVMEEVTAAIMGLFRIDTQGVGEGEKNED